MNAIEKLEQSIKATIPEASATLDRPRDSTGTWWLDVSARGRSIVVEWRPRHGFGVSAGRAEGYGEGSHERYNDLPSARMRALDLLQTGDQTSFPRDMVLQELREHAEISQAKLAKMLRVSQASISKLERRGDVRVSTLRRVVAALGGELELRVRLPDRVVNIKEIGE